MSYNALIIGGGVAGMQCALVLGSAVKKPFASDKSIGIIAHQRTSHLQNALFNNVLGLAPNTLGKDILINGKEQLNDLYPQVDLIENEKIISIEKVNDGYKIISNKKEYITKIAVIAFNYSSPLTIKGLEEYVEPHALANPEKNRIQLKNKNHLVEDGLYVCGTLAGWRSQFAIAAGSGASVATDILTLWNNGNHVKVHDKV